MAGAYKSRVYSQQGAGLIEFIIASMIGLIAIGIIGSIFLQGQKAATNRAKELSLLQSTNSALQLLKLDLHRAGYDGINGYSVKLSGASNTLHTQNGTDHGLIAYAYVSQVLGGTTTYRNIVYRQRASQPKVLQVCEKELNYVITAAQAEDFSNLVSESCNTLFHTRRISVDAFDVTISPLIGESVSSAATTISLTTYLTNQPSMTQQLSMTTKQRNWQ